VEHRCHHLHSVRNNALTLVGCHAWLGMLTRRIDYVVRCRVLVGSAVTRRSTTRTSRSSLSSSCVAATSSTPSTGAPSPMLVRPLAGADDPMRPPSWILMQRARLGSCLSLSTAKDLVRSLLTVDPAKRATPEVALKHPWIAGAEAPDKNIIDTFKEGLKKNPRERLRAAVNKVKVLNAFKHATDGRTDTKEEGAAGEE